MKNTDTGKGELVICHNNINSLSLDNFNGKDIDLLWYLCSQVKDNDTNLIFIDFYDIKRITEYKQNSYARLYEDVKNLNRKLQALQVNFESGEIGKRKFASFVLFPTYYVDEEKNLLEIRVNGDFTYLLNNLKRDFTTFGISNLVKLNSVYSKNLFRIFSQYKKTGNIYLKIEDFRNFMGIPESYRMRDIDKQVLSPAIDELSEFFKNINVEKQARNKGRKITHIHFTFDVDSYFNEGEDYDEPEIDESNAIDAEYTVYEESPKVKIEKKESKIVPARDQLIDEVKYIIRNTTGKEVTYEDAISILDACMNRENPLEHIHTVAVYSKTQGNIRNLVPWFIKTAKEFQPPINTIGNIPSYDLTSFNGYSQRKYSNDEIEEAMLGWRENPKDKIKEP